MSDRQKQIEAIARQLMRQGWTHWAVAMDEAAHLIDYQRGPKRG